ncbi:glycosyltransferase family 39 protein [Chloroflexi bacterium TSY]|nr:glycosyltransferase family 39 protein [Chloroflexi bacterium TSY]
MNEGLLLRHKINVFMVAMLLLHIVWLVLRWLLVTEPRLDKIPALLVANTMLGLLIIAWPRTKWSPLSSFFEHMYSSHRLIFALTTLLILMLDGIYIASLLLREDEMFLIVAVERLNRQGIANFFADYAQMTWLGVQHPPLSVLGPGGALYLIGGDVLMITRALSGLLGMATVVCTYLIARHLYDRQTAILAAFLLFTIRNFYIFNITASNDIYVTFFFSLTILLLLQVNNTAENLSIANMWWLLAAGVALGLGLLSKYTMVLAYLLLPAIIWWPFSVGSSNEKRIDPSKNECKEDNTHFLLLGVKRMALVVVVSLLFLGGWLWQLNQIGLLQRQSEQILFYVGLAPQPSLMFEAGVNEEIEEEATSSTTLDTDDHWLPWRTRYLLNAVSFRIPSAIGLYNLPLIAVGLWIYLTQRNRPQVMRANGFILLWIAIIFLPFLLTLPDPRYFMPSFPALAILMAHGVRTIGKESFRIVTLALLLSLSSLWVYTDFNQAQPFCIGELTLQDSGIEDLSPSGDWLCPGFSQLHGW